MQRTLPEPSSVNTIEDLLLLAESTYTDPLDIETPVINTIEDLLLLAVGTYTDPLVLLPQTYYIYNARALKRNKTKITYNLNVYRTQDIATQRQNRTRITYTLNAPYTSTLQPYVRQQDLDNVYLKRIPCTSTSRPNVREEKTRIIYTLNALCISAL